MSTDNLKNGLDLNIQIGKSETLEQIIDNSDSKKEEPNTCQYICEGLKIVGKDFLRGVCAPFAIPIAYANICDNQNELNLVTTSGALGAGVFLGWLYYKYPWVALFLQGMPNLGSLFYKVGYEKMHPIKKSLTDPNGYWNFEERTKTPPTGD